VTRPQRKDPPPKMPQTVSQAEALADYKTLMDRLATWADNVEPADLHPCELELLKAWERYDVPEIS